jgi:hypothetical protein
VGSLYFTPVRTCRGSILRIREVATGKVACITTIKGTPGRRDELLKLSKAHAKLMLAAEL